MWSDTIVEEIREIRQAHAQQYNYDLRAIFDALKAEERQSGRQVVDLPPKRVAGRKSAQSRSVGTDAGLRLAVEHEASV